MKLTEREKTLPNRAKPSTLTALATRMKLRSASELPRWKKSSTCATDQRTSTRPVHRLPVSSLQSVCSFSNENVFCPERTRGGLKSVCVKNPELSVRASVRAVPNCLIMFLQLFARNTLFENVSFSTKIGESEAHALLENLLFSTKFVKLRCTPYSKMDNCRRKLVKLRRTPYSKMNNIRRKFAKLRRTPFLKWAIFDEHW